MFLPGKFMARIICSFHYGAIALSPFTEKSVGVSGKLLEKFFPIFRTG